MTGAPSDALLARMTALHPKVIDLTLDRVWRLLDRLDNPQDRLPPVIHVAGTNGKGSTVAMLRAGLEAEGGTCHVYTSPHLVRFHERVVLAGATIPEPDLAAVLDECLAANGTDPITYFEITTVAALLAFSRTPADWTLLEVGLGGRLDATNVVKAPRATIVTPVSMDHQQFLGDTLAAIAGEKAGILKPGVPCIVGPQDEAARDVIAARAGAVGAPCRMHGQDWTVNVERGRLIYQDLHGLRDLPLPVLAGQHQIDNAGAAVATLREMARSDTALEGAMTGCRWPARMQRLTDHPLAERMPHGEVWLDGGHNAAAGAALAATLDTLARRETWLVTGMIETKSARDYLARLAGRCAGLVAVPVTGSDAGQPPEIVASAAREVGLTATTASDVADAVAWISARAPAARVVICGSLYLAGAVLAMARGDERTDRATRPD